MTSTSPKRESAYDRYIDYRRFAIAVAAFVVLIAIPIPGSMLDVAVEYSMGETYVLEFYCEELFGKELDEAEQWEKMTAQALEALMRQGALSKTTVLRRERSQLESMGIEVSPRHYESYRGFIEGIDEESFQTMMRRAYALRHDELTFDILTDAQKERAMTAAGHLQVSVAMVAFVVVCFVTEAVPLPSVAFCIGLILVFSGIVGRREVASLYWDDAVWFIMGSLMFAAAFVKTGVDRRICLIIFRSLARPSIGWITFVLILVIAPGAAFISDHALAAIFLPIAMILYSNSLSSKIPVDLELAKMLMITIAMACNIGGFGAPSGGARNVIIMTYLEDMFGITMGYGQWMVYGMPFVLVMIPVVWLLINWRFKPRIKDLTPSLESLKRDISAMGDWNRNQIVAITVFLVMLIGWITEKNLLVQLIGVRLGIGVIAMGGAVTYLLLGIVNWRDYQEKVDWGVVWLYAGAIIFGRVLNDTGTAYWMARSMFYVLADLGLSSGTALVAAGAFATSFLTNLMADGPAAAIGPVTLNMAGIAAAGTTLVPFMGLATSCASSFAYLLIIGTPPNAIVYASGYLEAKDFLRVGIPALVLAFLVLLFLTSVYWPMLGFGNLPPA